MAEFAFALAGGLGADRFVLPEPGAARDFDAEQGDTETTEIEYPAA